MKQKKFHLNIKYFPVTIIIVMISILIFILHLVQGEYGSYSEESINSLGGLNKELINQGEIWRLLTYTFGHMSTVHFIMNVPIFLMLSLPLEKKYGSVKFFLFFLIITVTSGLSIYLFYSGIFLSLAGLSGTGYGFAGMFTFLLLKTSEEISKSYRLFIIIMLCTGAFSAFDTSYNIAVSGHIGGFISGFSLALIVSVLKEKDVLLEKRNM